MNKWVWSIGKMIVTGKNQSTWRKFWASAILFTLCPTGLEPNLDLCGDRLITDCLSHGTVLSQFHSASNKKSNNACLECMISPEEVDVAI